MVSKCVRTEIVSARSLNPAGIYPSLVFIVFLYNGFSTLTCLYRQTPHAYGVVEKITYPFWSFIPWGFTVFFRYAS